MSHLRLVEPPERSSFHRSQFWHGARKEWAFGCEECSTIEREVCWSYRFGRGLCGRCMWRLLSASSEQKQQ